MSWIAGDKLTPTQGLAVLNAYGYRWTIENQARARQWLGGARGVPTISLVTDAEWLADHAFYVTRQGEISRRHRYCMPDYIVEKSDAVD